MAEEEQKNGAQNKLGELFVELGAKGAPTLLKNLNSVSASFLLGKNAATQFAQTLTKPLKEAGRTAVEVGKLATSLDTSYKNVQKLQYHFKKFGVGEGLINDLGALQTTLRNVFTGYAQPSNELAAAFENVHLNLENYSDDFEDILRLIKDLKNADLSRTQRNMAFDFLGLSRDWGYLFDRGDFNLEEALALPDSVIEKNIKTAENLQEFGLVVERLKDLFVAELLPPLTKFVGWFTGVTQDIINGKGSTAADKISKGFEDNAGKIGAGLGTVYGAKTLMATGNLPLAAAVGGTVAAGTAAVGNQAKLQRSVGGTAGKIVPTQFGAAQMDFGTAPWIKNKNKGTATGGAAPIYIETDRGMEDNMIAPTFMDTNIAGMPPNLQNMTQTINITNQNNINGTNATEIADKIININSQDIQYSQYQANHLPGI